MIHGATQRPQPRATLANGNAHILGLAALTEAVSAVANDNATERAESIGRADWSCLHARLAKRLEADGAYLLVQVQGGGAAVMPPSSAVTHAHPCHSLCLVHVRGGAAAVMPPSSAVTLAQPCHPLCLVEASAPVR